MKKLIAASLAACMLMGGCAAMAESEPYTNDWSVLPAYDETAEESVVMDYSALLEDYADAMADKASGYEPAVEYTSESVMMALDAEKVGFVLKDLDGDGNAELMVVASDAENPFLDKMVLLLATNDGTSAHVVFESGERSRYYYAGENKFAYEGSNGADDSTITTYALENGQLTDLGTETAETDYVLPEMEIIEVAE